jgi:hypothetical protein
MVTTQHGSPTATLLATELCNNRAAIQTAVPDVHFDLRNAAISWYLALHTQAFLQQKKSATTR